MKQCVQIWVNYETKFKFPEGLLESIQVKNLAETDQVSRREFVKMAGAALGGLAIGAIGGYSLIPPKETIVTNDIPLEVPDHPWTYTKLNVEAVKARAYNAYFQGGCSYAVFEGIIGELREQVGHPFTAIPTMMATFGSGGIKGWGTTCGTLIGGGMAVTTVSTGAVLNDMMGWYTETALPNYVPATATKVEGDIPKSVAEAPLCHASVTNWCNASGFSENDPERAERCGRLCADMAGKIVEMLNAEADGTYTQAFASPDSVIECGACHGKDGPVNNVFTQMDCDTCHGDPHA